MRRLGLVLGALIGVLAVLAPSAGRVLAHAELEEVVPADGAVVPDAPEVVTLRFSEPVSLIGGSARVLDDEGTVVADDATAAGDTVAIPLPSGLGDGTYTIAWQIISADSHRVSGASVFHVGAPSPGGAGPVAPAGDGDLPWALRFGTTALIAFAYGATLVAVGVVWFAGFVARLGDREATAWRVLVRNAAIVGICALLVGLPARAARLGGGIDALDDGEFVAETLRGPIGMSTAVTVAALVALVALVSSRRSGRSMLLSLVGLVALAGFPIEGHTRTTEPRALMIAFDLLHLVAGAVWLGGIAGLIVVFRSRLDPVRVGEIVRRFSTAAVAGVVVVATAGIGMSIIVLPALSDLWSTSYGLALLTKVALVAVVVVLGSYIRRRLVPALDAGAAASPFDVRDRIAGIVRIELGVLVAVVIVTAILVGRSPSASEAASPGADPVVPTTAAPQPIEAALSNAAGTVSVAQMPTSTGSFETGLRLEDAGADPLVPVEVPRVVLRERGLQLGPLELEVHELGAGEYHVFGDVPVPGTWELEVTVRVSEFDQATATVTTEVAR